VDSAKGIAVADAISIGKKYARPIAKRVFGSGYNARIWLRWGLARIKSFRGFRPIYRGTWVEYDVPGHAWTVPLEIASPGRGEVLIRTIASAVSPGTERAFYSLDPNAVTAFPCSVGYSLAGEVWKVGRGVQYLHPGQLVAAQAPHASGFVVPSEMVFALPEGVSPEEGAFIYIGIIALHGVWRGQLQAGERAAVLGRGIIGQLAVQMLHASGASEVVSIAPSSRRHTPALDRFAQRLIATAEESASVLETVKADVTYEASGNPRAIRDALSVTRDGGRVVLLGSPRGVTTDFDFGELSDRGITLLGAHISTLSRERNAKPYNYRMAGETFLRLVTEKKMDIRSLIDIQVNPWSSGWFYRNLAKGQENWVGALMRWDYMPEAERLHRVSYWTSPDLENVRGMTMMPQKTLSERATPSHVTMPVEKRTKTDSRTASSEPVLRLAVIGCGEQGSVNAGAAKAVGNISLSTVVDVSETAARRLGERLGVPWTTDYMSVLDSKNIDAVFINTPHHRHAEQAIQAAQAGKHIILEKPLAHDLENAVRIVRAAHEAGVKLSVWLGFRYLPQIVLAKKLVDAGALGNMLGGYLTNHLSKPVHYWQRGYTGIGNDDWRSHWESAGGGVFLQNTIHYLDWLLYISGLKVTEVSAHYATLDSPADVEDTFVAWFTLNNGALVTVNASSCVTGLRQTLTECRLWGSEGHLSLTPPYQFYSSQMIEGRRPERWHNLKPLPRLRSPQIEYLERFARAVLRGEQPEITGEEGLRLQEVIEAAYRSCREGHPVRVEYTEL